VTGDDSVTTDKNIGESIVKLGVDGHGTLYICGGGGVTGEYVERPGSKNPLGFGPIGAGQFCCAALKGSGIPEPGVGIPKVSGAELLAA
jgi:hypothetical protein